MRDFTVGYFDLLCLFQDPMSKMKKVSPLSLEGDKGWQLREAYMDCMKDFEQWVFQHFKLHSGDYQSSVCKLIGLWGMCQ